MIRIVFTAFAAFSCLQLASTFNLYIDKDFGTNVLRWADLFPGDESLYFIKDSLPYSRTVENPLLQFITIQTTSRLQFTWDSDPDEIVDYNWAFTSTDVTVLDTPYLTINHAGVVPRNEVFYFVFPCTGLNPTTVGATVLLTYNITSKPNNTFVHELQGNTTGNMSQNATVAPQTTGFIVPLGVRVNCEMLAPTSDPETDDSSPLWPIGLALGIVVVIVVVVVLIVLLLKRKRKEERTVNVLERELTMLREAQETSSARYMDITSNRSGSVNGSLTYKETVALRMHNASIKATRPHSKVLAGLKEDWFEKLEDCLVEFYQLKFEEQLGKGAFGFVFKGILSLGTDPTITKTVALKTMKNVDSEKDMSRFLSEGIVMKDFHHPNVMGLSGVCFPEEDPPIIILPFMANGDLHTFLKKRRGSVASIDKVDTHDHMLTTDHLMEFVVDICCGMEYLSAQKFVHRDLAARNCMLDEAFVVKIGDFGLAKEMHEDLYYRLGTPTKLPVKWMAVESLDDQIFTMQTDVWSFGVTVWEVMSLGRQPYPGVANHELTEHLMKGHRLQKPEGCTDELYEIMASCWKEDPTVRPTFSELMMMLERLEGGRYVANCAEPDGYENVSPRMKSPPGDIAQNTSSTAEDKRVDCMKNGSAVSSGCMENGSAVSSDDRALTLDEELAEKSNYLSMSLKSSTLDSAKEAAAISPDDSGGDYLVMSLSPLLVNMVTEESRGHSICNERPLSLVGQQQPQGNIDDDDIEYMKMGLKPKEDCDEDDKEYMRMGLQPMKMGLQSQEGGDEDDDEYMKMGLRFGKRSEVGAQPLFSREDDDQEEYMRMAIKASGSDNGVQQSDDRNCEYMKMTAKQEITERDVAEEKVNAASNI